LPDCGLRGQRWGVVQEKGRGGPVLEKILVLREGRGVQKLGQPEEWGEGVILKTDGCGGGESRALGQAHEGLVITIGEDRRKGMWGRKG